MDPQRRSHRSGASGGAAVVVSERAAPAFAAAHDRGASSAGRDARRLVGRRRGIGRQYRTGWGRTGWCRTGCARFGWRCSGWRCCFERRGARRRSQRRIREPFSQRFPCGGFPGRRARQAGREERVRPRDRGQRHSVSGAACVELSSIRPRAVDATACDFRTAFTRSRYADFFRGFDGHAHQPVDSPGAAPERSSSPHGSQAHAAAASERHASEQHVGPHGHLAERRRRAPP